MTRLGSTWCFRQGLPSILHFRQCKLPNLELGEGLIRENARILMNLRQGIASHHGKVIGQVSGRGDCSFRF
jgi:hypothetical protein